MDQYSLSYGQPKTPPSKIGFVKDFISSEKVLYLMSSADQGRIQDPVLGCEAKEEKTAL